MVDAQVPGDAQRALADALEVLRSRLATLALPLDVPDVAADRVDRAALLDQLDDYLLPRVRVQGAPLLVVVGGSTGAGKSTLVSSVVGEVVSAAGVLRPTTRSPVLVHHPGDVAWFGPERLLPGLARATGAPGAHVTDPGPGPGALRLVATERVPRGLALLDAPDVDSVEQGNRELAAQLLAAADLWLFVTTAARYADAVPWDLLGAAARRHAQVALVLDRVDPAVREEVAVDLARLADAEGLALVRTFVVEESALEDGMLPERAVAPLSRWLTGLAADDGAREAAALATRDGAVDDAVRRAARLVHAATAQQEATDRLRALVDAAGQDAVRHVHEATSDGTMLRGEVLARWQEIVGTGEMFARLQSAAGRTRDRVVGFFRGRSRAVPELGTAIAQGLELVLLDAAQSAGERARQAWRLDPVGRALLSSSWAQGDGDDRAAVRAAVDEQVRGWQDDVVRLVQAEGQGKRATARALSLGINAVGATLMLAVFASTAGLTGAELGIAGGTAAASQAVLTAVFGDEAVRSLARRAREALDARTRAVLDVQAEQLLVLLRPVAAVPGSADGLRDAADDLARAAVAERDARARSFRAAADMPVRATTGRLRGADLRDESADPPGPVGPGAPGAPGAPGTGAPAGTEPRAGFWRRVLRGGRP